MFSWFKSVISTEDEVITKFLAKTTGQRGPLISVIPGKHKNDQICLCVTPCSIFVFFWDTAPLGKRLALEDDAFTCAVAFGTSAVLAGTQNGQVCNISLDQSLAFKSTKLRHGLPEIPVTAIACTKDSKRYTAGFADGSIAYWLASETDAVFVGESHTGTAVTALIVVESTNTLAAGYADGNVIFFCLETLVISARLPGLCHLPVVIRWHEHMEILLISDSNRELLLVKISDYTVLHRYDASLVTCGAALTCLEIVGERQLLLLGASDGSFCVRELSASEKAPHKLRCQLLRMWEVSAGDAGPVTCAAFDAKSDILLVGDAGCRVRAISEFTAKIQEKQDSSLHRS